MRTFLTIAAVTGGTLLTLAGVLHLIPLLGRDGKRLAAMCTRAPVLDVLIVLFQIAPLAVGCTVGYATGLGGFWGGLAALGGMLLAYFAWVALHELTHLKAVRGARIVKTMNRISGGRLRNHAAVWATALALPVFWFIRAGEIIVYPMLVRLLRFPRYEQREWVQVSRQKFSGLVGHDLIWCLYCDWMTGVYALGAEMLRNVESYWCPIRFYDGKKCANCAVDFPDVNAGWVPADGTMVDVTAKLEEMYGSGRREWFGHPARLTVGGRAPGPVPGAVPSGPAGPGAAGPDAAGQDGAGV